MPSPSVVIHSVTPWSLPMFLGSTPFHSASIPRSISIITFLHPSYPVPPLPPWLSPTLHRPPTRLQLKTSFLCPPEDSQRETHTFPEPCRQPTCNHALCLPPVLLDELSLFQKPSPPLEHWIPSLSQPEMTPDLSSISHLSSNGSLLSSQQDSPVLKNESLPQPFSSLELTHHFGSSL